MNEKLLFLFVSLVCLVIGALVGYYAIPKQENYKGARVPSGFNKYISPNTPPSVTLIPEKKPAPMTSISEKKPVVSTDGRCGRNFGKTMCPKGSCCSIAGWCGTTRDHCCSGNQPSSNGYDAPTKICNAPFLPSAPVPPMDPQPPKSGADFCKEPEFAYKFCMERIGK